MNDRLPEQNESAISDLYDKLYMLESMCDMDHTKINELRKRQTNLDIQQFIIWFVLISFIVVSCSGCVSKEQYQQLHESFSQYVQTDKEKWKSINDHIDASIAINGGTNARYDLQRASLKSWLLRIDRAEDYLTDMDINKNERNETDERKQDGG